jgi:hypothetical protein
MKSIDFSRYAVSISIAAALLAGCGGSQPPVAAPGGTSQQAVRLPNQLRGESSGSILYVSQGHHVTILTYPELRILGKFKNPTKYGLGQGCPDNVSGNIYFPMASHYVDLHVGSGLTEYADGGAKPIGSLKPPHGEYAVNCAVDATTGNIAVILGTEQDSGEVGIYAPGSQRPVRFRYPDMHWYASCGYDDMGNLFVEGETNKKFLFLELPKGGSKLIKLSLNPKKVTLGFPVQWDGSYVTIEYLDLDTAILTIYRISVSGSKATEVGNTKLRGAGLNSWIQDGSTVITGRCCKDANSSSVLFYNYPAGGKPRSVFKGLRKPHGGPRREVLGLVVATPLSGVR